MQSSQRRRRRGGDKRVLQALLKTLTSKDDLDKEDQDTVMQITMEKVLGAVGAQKITVFLVDESDERVHFAYTFSAPSLTRGDAELAAKYAAEAERLRTMSLPKGKGIVGRVIETGKPYILMDAQSDPNFYGGIDTDTGFMTKSMITVPIKTERVLGAIQVLNKDESAGIPFFTKADMSLLQEVADYSARIIEKVANPDLPFGPEEKAQYVARLTGHEYYDLGEDFAIDPKMIEAIGGSGLIVQTRIIPIEKSSASGIKVGMANPLDLPKKETFGMRSGMRIDEVVVVSEGAVGRVITALTKETIEFEGTTSELLEAYGTTETEAVDVDSDDEDSAPIVKLANQIIEDAYVQGASDIHVEPQEDSCLIRYRIDGAMEKKLSVPKKAQSALCARLKIMSELDISERRLPQDGRIIFKKHNKKFDVDLRVSTAPMNFGEKLCMRILDKTKSALPLDKLGYSEENLKIYRRIIEEPYGMILHCGPTGSGKSMTLYSALGEINTPDINISTAEDPIEYTLKGINQMQMHKQIGLTFARALRCFLRQDPDIILVGEIRDSETAEIAIEAALTGHLLFSTLHTNDASSTPARLLEMDIEPFMVSASLLCVCAQRLLRRVCSKCKVEYEPDDAEMQLLELDTPMTIKKAKPGGCPKCNGAGYKGRVGVHELMLPNDEIRMLINKRAASTDIRREARAAGMRTLFQDGMDKVKAGISTVEEVVANIRNE
jgi:type II secretory ATPase GspE/PulE/Tfp pilus assembly ATPase PilB-like protein